LSLITKILFRLITLLQLALVIIFIIFEEIIWEGFAKPIYHYIHELKILQSAESKLQGFNRYVVLVIFMALLISVEVAGLVAGVMALQGMMLTAILIYALKLPIAAFTFWLFRVTDEKLLSFDWFRWGYDKIMALIAWIKSRQIYTSTIKRAKELKNQTRSYLSSLKAKYFTGDNTISKRFRRLYRYIKGVLDKR